jgi:hypothetical protein
MSMSCPVCPELVQKTCFSEFRKTDEKLFWMIIRVASFEILV